MRILKMWFSGAWLFLAVVLNANATDLMVYVDGVTNDRGFVCVAIHCSESTWLDNEGSKAFRRGKVAARMPGVTVHFPDLPAGKCAIKVFQDEDNDGKLNRNFFGAPTEPYGFSNNVRARFSLPPFEEAMITVQHATMAIRVDLVARH